MTHTFSKYVRIRYFDVVFMGKKLLKFSKLAMRDLLGAIMVPISPQRRQGKISQRDEMPQNSIQGEMKAVTTCSGLAYEGPSIPAESPLDKVDEQNTKEILDKEHSNSLGSTAQVQPSVVPISILEPDVLRTQSKPTIPYPSRLNDQKL
nr:reverse transcriptase domain-containing protein [Tanacetum cinerariifolium]